MKSLIYAPIFIVLIFTLYAQDAHAIGGTISDQTSCEAIGGTWNGDADICEVSSPLTISSGETLIISSSITFRNFNIVDNSGVIDNFGAVENFDTLTNQPGGIITNQPTGIITNFNFIDNSGTVDNSGTLDNNSFIVNADTITNQPGGILTNQPGSYIENLNLIDNFSDVNNSGEIANFGAVNNHCGATYFGPPLTPNPVNDIPCASFSPPFTVPFPIFTNDSVCTPLVMNTDVSATESWYVKSAGGTLSIEVIAHAVNGIDPETVTATAYDPSNNPVGTTTVSYPPGTPNGSEFSSFIVIPGTIPNDIYRIDIITPLTPPTQPHYRLKFDGALEAGISSPTFASLEEEPVKWILNVNPSENLDIDFFTTDVPTPATTVTYSLRSPSGIVTGGTIPIIPGSEISIPSAEPGAWILEVITIDGHYRLSMGGGIDNGIYVSGISKPECNPIDLVVDKTGPASVTAGSTIHYDIHVENVGTKVATDVLLTDTIPTELVGLSLTGASPQCGPLVSGYITCPVGDMQPSSFFDIFIELQIPPGLDGNINNNAQAISTRPDLTPANNADVQSTLVSSDGGLVTISIANYNVIEGHSGTATATFLVSLSSPSAQTISVDFATQDISAKTADNDYSGTTGTLTFLPGEISNAIDVTIYGDLSPEPNETFYVNLSNPVNAVFGDNQGIGIILNDDLDPFLGIPVNTGGRGTIVNLAGYDFAPETPISVKFDDLELALIPSNLSGDFFFPLTIPLVSPGIHAITGTDGTYQSSTAFVVIAPRLTATDTASYKNIVTSTSPGTLLNLYMKGFAANDPSKTITVFLNETQVGSPVSPNKIGSFKAFPLFIPVDLASQYDITATDGTNTKSITISIVIPPGPSVILDSELYNPQEDMVVTVNDYGASGNVPVQITSDTDPVGISKILDEISLGRFANVDPVLFTLSPDTGKLLVSNGDTITTTYGAAMDTASFVVLEAPDPAPTPDVTITLDKQSYLFEQAAQVLVFDPAVVFNSEDPPVVHFTTNPDGVTGGINVPLSPYVSPSTFTNQYLVTLSNHLPDDSSYTTPVLHVSTGQSVYATYDLGGTLKFANAAVVEPTGVLAQVGVPADNTVIVNCDALDAVSDSDGDAICNSWEDPSHVGLQITQNSAVFSYPPAGSTECTRLIDDPSEPFLDDTNNPITCPSINMKDLFVEIDYMESHKPEISALVAVTNAFKNKGINLHTLIDEQLLHKDLIPLVRPDGSNDRNNFNDIKFDHFGTVSERENPLAADILTAKRQAFHYSLWAHSRTDSPTSSGWGEIGGNDIMVTTGALAGGVGSIDQQAGIYMHELGHNLNLTHGGGGGADDTNCKSNYPSVMNYLLQFDLFVPNRPLDFSSSKYTKIDESVLSETGTYMKGPARTSILGGIANGVPFTPVTTPLTSTGHTVDWNRNGPTAGTYTQNTHYVGISGCQDGSIKVLNGYNDWAWLQFNMRESLNFADGAHNDPAVQGEITQEMVHQIIQITGAPPPMPAAPHVTNITNLDLAVANHFSNNTSILLGNGTGSFGTATDFATGLNPTSIAVADFNGDTKDDLAVANSPGAVSILIGNGAGGFGAATNYTTGAGSFSVAVADFNGDTKDDLVTANSDNGTVSILIGNGAGGFGAATNFAVGLVPISVAVADFNDDTKDDLAVADYFDTSVFILLGNGAGGFGTAINYTAGFAPYSVAVSDFNGDTKDDLAVANLYGNSVSILLGNGAGGFGTATNYAVDEGPTSVAVADFNSDEIDDLVTANYFADTISILIGNGTGGFIGPTNFAVGDAPTSVAVSDFNDDEIDDLAVGNEISNDVSILLGNGAGGFGTATNFAVGGGPFSVAVGRFG